MTDALNLVFETIDERQTGEPAATRRRCDGRAARTDGDDRHGRVIHGGFTGR